MKQTWNAELYDDKHSFVWKHGSSLVELLAPKTGERILDLGCGTGHLTAQIAAVGAEVIGIDQSVVMIEEARKKFPQLRFESADARDFHFAEPFDAVFSNAVLHWVPEPDRVIACVQRSLKPGGRFVAEFGGRGNVRAIVAAMQNALNALGYENTANPWFYPTIAEYAGHLEQGGLEVTFATLFDRPTPLEGDNGMRHWVEMFRAGLLQAIPAEGREEFLERVETELRPILFRDGQWIADYRRLRVVANRLQE